MKKFFTELSHDEFQIIETSFFELEQENWSLEKEENKYFLCGYFDENFLNSFSSSWENLIAHIPFLQQKTLTEINIQQQGVYIKHKL